MPVTLSKLVRDQVSPVGNVPEHGNWLIDYFPPRLDHTHRLLPHHLGVQGLPLIFYLSCLFQAQNSLLEEILLQFRSDVVKTIAPTFLQRSHQLNVTDIIIIRPHYQVIISYTLALSSQYLLLLFSEQRTLSRQKVATTDLNIVITNYRQLDTKGPSQG